MAKVTGPLFSFSASGSINRKLTFRNNERYFVAQRPPVPTGPASPWQLTERQSMKDAAAAWASLSNTDRAIWGNSELPTIRSAWMSFFMEFKTQRVKAGAVPLIPAQYIGTPTRVPFPPAYVPTNHGTHRAHYTARDWMHGIYFDHNRGQLRTHGIADSHAATVIPGPNRGALRTHGTVHAAPIPTPPGHQRGDLRIHGIANRKHLDAPPAHDRGDQRTHASADRHEPTTPPGHQRGALRPHGSRGRPRRN